MAPFRQIEIRRIYRILEFPDDLFQIRYKGLFLTGFQPSPDPLILVSIKALICFVQFLPNLTPYSLPTVDSIAVDSILPSNQPSSSNCGKKK